MRGSIRTSNVVLYASFGSVLTPYALNIDTAELVRSEAVTLPENVQYAWPHGRPARCQSLRRDLLDQRAEFLGDPGAALAARRQ